MCGLGSSPKTTSAKTYGTSCGAGCLSSSGSNKKCNLEVHVAIQAPGLGVIGAPMSYSQNSLKGAYIGDQIGEYSRGHSGGYQEFRRL